VAALVSLRRLGHRLEHRRRVAGGERLFERLIEKLVDVLLASP
jgi:hypothetical protein